MAGNDQSREVRDLLDASGPGSVDTTTEIAKGPRLRLSRQGIAEAVARGRMSATRAEELLADDRVPTNPLVGVHLYPAHLPIDTRTAPVTIALVSRIDGPDRAVMIRREARGGWLVFTDDDGPLTVTDPSVAGWHNAVASARAFAFSLAKAWLA